MQNKQSSYQSEATPEVRQAPPLEQVIVVITWAAMLIGGYKCLLESFCLVVLCWSVPWFAYIVGVLEVFGSPAAKILAGLLQLN